MNVEACVGYGTVRYSATGSKMVCGLWVSSRVRRVRWVEAYVAVGTKIGTLAVLAQLSLKLELKLPSLPRPSRPLLALCLGLIVDPVDVIHLPDEGAGAGAEAQRRLHPEVTFCWTIH